MWGKNLGEASLTEEDEGLMEPEGVCLFCEKSLFAGRLGFRDECPHCHADLHICLNCRFYDTSSYGECREPSAQRVKEKDRNNHCEYFEKLPPGQETKNVKTPAPSSEDLKARARALFKKP